MTKETEKEEAIRTALRYIGRALIDGEWENWDEDESPPFILFEASAERDSEESDWQVVIRFPKDFYIRSDDDRVEVTILNDLAIQPE